ncbi:Uncharacterised protein [Mannheimia haemolytica]|uniref:Uncharacterized protein n=1 Tax=Mannheimia haemolytica TaxID=75985 RepID=A0A378MWQ8_MANHA|nr:Uncharacterised protein [Mannheimia haemolytica]
MKALELIDLVKTYPTGVKAVKGINLVVEQGDFYALLGITGQVNLLLLHYQLTGK